jgi:hypothetical protein
VIVIDCDLSEKSDNYPKPSKRKSKFDNFKKNQYQELKLINSALEANPMENAPLVILMCTMDYSLATEENKEQFSRFEKLCTKEKWAFEHINDEDASMDSKYEAIYQTIR